MARDHIHSLSYPYKYIIEFDPVDDAVCFTVGTVTLAVHTHTLVRVVSKKVHIRHTFHFLFQRQLRLYPIVVHHTLTARTSISTVAWFLLLYICPDLLLEGFLLGFFVAVDECEFLAVLGDVVLKDLSPISDMFASTVLPGSVGAARGGVDEAVIVNRETILELIRIIWPQYLAGLVVYDVVY